MASQLEHQQVLTDVQRRSIFSELVTKDEVPTLAIEKDVPGGSSKRIMLLNKVDAQQLKRVLDDYLNHVYGQEVAGINASLSPKDMVAIFGVDDD